MTYTVSDPAALGRTVRETRRALGLTQPKLALSAGVGVRFLVDIEKGKPTAQIGKKGPRGAVVEWLLLERQRRRQGHVIGPA